MGRFYASSREFEPPILTSPEIADGAWTLALRNAKTGCELLKTEFSVSPRRVSTDSGARKPGG
jgi:hypothetical protein